MNLARRGWLTLRHHGPRELVRRLRPSVRSELAYLKRTHPLERRALAWYAREARPVAVVIPTFGASELLTQTVESVRATTEPGRVRVLVADDGSPPEQVGRLRSLQGVELIEGDEPLGFAANANRGLRAIRSDEDAVVLNSDMIAHANWLESLQFGAYLGDDIGIVGPKLLYPDGRIQSAGSHRNPAAPEWFDHRFRFRPSDFAPAQLVYPCLALTGAALYIKRELIEAIGLLDDGYRMAYEDVDYCLRAWEAGFRVLYWPHSTLTHLESQTRGKEQGERELATQRRFWSRWGGWFDGREVRTAEGALRIVYVSEDTGVGGGARVVFQHLNALRARGHEVELWTLAEPPAWFELEVPVRTFRSYEALWHALAPLEAIKVATWWKTAGPVWRASVRRGIPVYLVQDVETSYYPAEHRRHAAVYESYRSEFRYLTTSTWLRDRLREWQLDPTVVSPGVDLATFHRLPLERHEGAILTVGRSNPLKNFGLTLSAYERLAEPPELWLFGIEPDLGVDVGATYHEAPDDAQLNELLNRATVFLQTSRHEGFCLPILEAMAAGTPVVCTDADGNRDFCRDGENCLMPEANTEAVAAALARVLEDRRLRDKLVEGGMRTAAEYAWERKLDQIERFYMELSRAPAYSPG